MSVQSTVPCPDCGSGIPIDSQLLLSGAHFKCPSASCAVSISLAQQDVETVSKAINEFEAIKQQALHIAAEKNDGNRSPNTR